MAKKQHYKITGNHIYADVAHLTVQEAKLLKGYVALGFKVINQVPPKETPEEKEAKAKKNPYTQTHIEAFLNKKENEEFKKTYDDCCDEPSKKDPSNKKGFINGLRWFRSEFEYTLPEYDEEKGTYIAKKKENEKEKENNQEKK